MTAPRPISCVDGFERPATVRAVPGDGVEIDKVVVFVGTADGRVALELPIHDVRRLVGQLMDANNLVLRRARAAGHAPLADVAVAR